MRLDAEERKRVEENMKLVHKVIRDKIPYMNLTGFYTREDLFQIGCIGLCKAAATDKGGCFSTYAYRLIWNEICDALIAGSRKWSREVVVEFLPEERNSMNDSTEVRVVLDEVLTERKDTLSPTIEKGIQALLWMEQGYSGKEIGRLSGASASLVCARVSKARRYLRERKELIELAQGYGYEKAG
ncbi:MAG: sigma-70 family RNA polymerase sigma factor [Lachnospiraceae bacterium]|nr:sigma-70 family RNA polymerase sigma factor [Lachnospiraceae bacterium]